MLNPSPERRAGLDEIFQHPWFLKDLPPGALGMNDWCGGGAGRRERGAPGAGRQRRAQAHLAFICSSHQAFPHPRSRHPPLPAPSTRYMDNADSLHDRLELVQTIVETASATGHEGEPLLQCFF